MISEKEYYVERYGILATVIGSLIVASNQSSRDLAGRFIRWIWSASLIPGWILILMFPFAFIGIVRLYRTLRPTREPVFKRYTEDSIYDIEWRWSWAGNKISNLRCYCLQCDAKLVCDDSSCSNDIIAENKTDFFCKRCRLKITTIAGGDKNYAFGMAEKEILRRLRLNEIYPLY
jgi:hypothetical protein